MSDAHTPGQEQPKDGNQIPQSVPPPSASPGRLASIPGWIAGRFREHPVRATLLGAILCVTLVTLYQMYHAPVPSDVPTAWNEGIARLGIQPLYPPQEDFRVGDIWIMPVAASAGDVTLIGKAARIGHLDLTPSILADAKPQLRFETTKPKGDDSFRPQELHLGGTEIKPGVPVYAIGFPGISLDNSSRADTSLGMLTAYVSSWFGSSVSDTITISSAETYGAPTADALYALGKHCTDEDTRGDCQDGPARHLLHFVDRRFTETDCSGNFIYPLQIVLVTRVFAAREIDRVYLRGAGGAVGGSGAAPEAKDGTEGAPDQETRAAGLVAPPPARKGDGLGWEMRHSDGVSLARQVFPRALVFGYRSVSFAIPVNSAENAKLKDKKPWSSCAFQLW